MAAKSVGLQPSPPDCAAGLFWGGCGVLAFSFSLPATHLALLDFSALFTTFGRTAGAGLAAILFLAMERSPLPPRSDLRSIALVSGGVVIGFPLLTSLAMRTVPVAHGGIVVGLIPILTTLGAVFLGERPSRSFWFAATLGLLSVTLFSLLRSGGGVSPGHLLLVVAAAAAAIGYSAGAGLARRMAPSHVICWALVLMLPFSVPAALVTMPPGIGEIATASWFGMGYLTFISMFLGFFALYRGLATGGVARVSQLQLAQPLLTICWAWMLFGEVIEVATTATGCMVVFSIWLTLRSRVSDTPKLLSDSGE